MIVIPKQLVVILLDHTNAHVTKALKVMAEFAETLKSVALALSFVIHDLIVKTRKEVTFVPVREGLKEMVMTVLVSKKVDTTCPSVTLQTG